MAAAVDAAAVLGAEAQAAAANVALPDGDEHMTEEEVQSAPKAGAQPAPTALTAAGTAAGSASASVGAAIAVAPTPAAPTPAAEPARAAKRGRRFTAVIPQIGEVAVEAAEDSSDSELKDVWSAIRKCERRSKRLERVVAQSEKSAFEN